MTGISQMLHRLEQAVQSFGRHDASSADAVDRGDLLALALVDIARHYAKTTSRIALTAGLPLVGGRLPLEHIEAASRRAGLRAEIVQQPLDALMDVRLPVIVLTTEAGCDVLWSIERDAKGKPEHFTLSEPGRSELKARVRASEFATAATGRVIYFHPAGSDALAAGTDVPTRQEDWFLPAFSASRRVYSEAIAATVAINVLALAMPLFTMNVYDRVLPNAAQETLWWLAIGVIFATVFDFAIKTLRGRFVDSASRRADVLLGNLIYARLLGARLALVPASAGVRANTMREFETLRDFFNSATLTAFGDLPFVLLFLLMIWVVGGSLVLIPLAGVPLLLGIGWITQRAVGGLMEASVKETAQKNAVVVEALVGLESIKAAGAESWAAGKWERAIAEHIRTGNELRHLSNMGLHTVHATQTIIQVVMIIVGFYMVAAGALTTGGLIASTMLAGRAVQPLGQMAMLIARLHQTRLSYRMLSDIVRAPQERPDNATFIAKTKLVGKVAFEEVTFRYDKDVPPALDKVSFALAPGERVGLVGGIGTGKSTALKLIHSLHLPDTGRVLVDDVPAGQIDPALLRTHVSLALQDAELFHGTIRSNITLAHPQASDEMVLEAANLTGALEWILRLPKGFDTPVRERGAGLSGGQRQSLVLARSLLPRPRILLLDEPTSDMDPRTEQQVVERLKPWLAGRTTLIVTHRPAMLALVDRLIVLDNGRKRYDGPKASVLAAMSASVTAAKPMHAEEKPA